MRPQRGDLIAAVVVECARVGEDVSLSLLVAEHADNAIPPVIRGRRWRSSAQRAWTVIQRCCLACARTISIQDSTQQEVFPDRGSFMPAECALIVMQKPRARSPMSVDVNEGAAIDRKRHTGNEIRLVRGEE